MHYMTIRKHQLSEQLQLHHFPTVSFHREGITG